MPSPFPGMDPYIEHHALWGDFHNSLANSIRTQLNAKIRPNYYARQIPYSSLEKFCPIAASGDVVRNFSGQEGTYETLTIGRTTRTVPDVSIFQKPHSLREPKAEYSVTAVAEPPKSVESEVEEPLTFHSVEIYTAGDDELVSVIEILSPINKRAGRNAQEQYLRKRQDILNTNTIHLLEIDLLRGGNRPPLLRPVPDAPYYILLSRAEVRPRVTVWPIQLDDALPVVAMPLKYPDADVEFDMADVVVEVYTQGAYDIQINYGESPPAPPLSDEQQQYTDTLLKPLR